MTINSLKNKIKKVAKNALPYGITKKIITAEDSHIMTSLTCISPELYSSEGKKLLCFYLQDKGTEHVPYTYGFVNYGKPKYIVWDRFNYYLKTHFYVDSDIFHIHGKSDRRYAMVYEALSILPQNAKKIMDNKDYINGEFENIFTSSNFILQNFPSALFVPTTLWYGGVMGGTFDPFRYLKKTKNISCVASEKNFTTQHKFRQQIAWKYKSSGLVDTFGRFDGGPYVPLEKPFDEYRYSIVIENELDTFTEKLLNCFASMTVPIYNGSHDISSRFNMDGIIVADSEIEIENAVKMASKEDYESRLEAIKDNYNRVMDYVSLEEYIFKHYPEITKSWN